eukprot:Pgem_evm1s6471
MTDCLLDKFRCQSLPDLYELIGIEVRITTSNKKVCEGIVITIDPESFALWIKEQESEAIIVIFSHSITNFE